MIIREPLKDNFAIMDSEDSSGWRQMLCTIFSSWQSTPEINYCSLWSERTTLLDHDNSSHNYFVGQIVQIQP